MVDALVAGATRRSAALYYGRSLVTLIRDFCWDSAALRGLILWKRRSAWLVTLRRPRLSFRIRTLMDLWILKETCADRCYEKAGLRPGNGWRIVDIGAGIGDFAALAAHECPDGEVFAYEPFPGSFDLLRENLRRNALGNVKARPAALAGTRGRRRLDTSGREAVLHTTARAGEPSIEVEAVTLEDVFAENGLLGCDLMKMDVEGAEYEVLYQTSEETLRRVARLVVEVHGARERRSELTSYLSRSGFRVRFIPDPVHADLGILYAENQSLLPGE